VRVSVVAGGRTLTLILIAAVIASIYSMSFSTYGHINTTIYLSIDFICMYKYMYIYIIFFICNVQQSSEFSVFVNGEVVPYTITGNNSGAGQIVLRNMLKLKKMILF